MNLRDAMPNTAAIIDDLRAAFGKDAIEAQIRAGMQGIPGAFHAREGGHEVGTPMAPIGYAVDGTQMVIGSSADIIEKGKHADRKTGR